MIFKLFPILAALVSNGLTVNVAGYLGNACNGEELFGYTSPTDGTCVDLSGTQGAESLTVTSFGEGEFITFYSDTACSGTQAGTSNEDQCFLVPSTIGVQSFVAEAAISKTSMEFRS